MIYYDWFGWGVYFLVKIFLFRFIFCSVKKLYDGLIVCENKED